MLSRRAVLFGGGAIMLGAATWIAQGAMRPQLPWEVKRRALRDLAALVTGLPTVMAAPPAVTVGASDVSAIAGSNITLVEDEATRRSFGGRFYKYPFAGTNWATWRSVHLNGTDDEQLGGAIEFVTSSTTFEIIVDGAGKLFTVSVDGQPVQPEPLQNPAGARFFKVTFSTSASRRILVRFMNGITWQGIKLPVGEAMAASTPGTLFRCVVAGDSFTEGTGAIAGGVTGFGLLGFANVAGQALGLEDLWSSGSGGTGWAKTNGAQVNLLDRLGPDVISPVPDAVILATGINDVDASAAGANAVAALAQLRMALPAALIFVVGPWDVWVPAAMSSAAIAVRDALAAACLGQSRVWFFDPTGVVYEKAGGGDVTHPSRAGHRTLGLWLANQIRAELDLAPIS